MEELVELRERLAMLAAHWDDEPLQVLEKISKTHCAEVSRTPGRPPFQASELRSNQAATGPYPWHVT